jgi:hypothetical protein
MRLLVAGQPVQALALLGERRGPHGASLMPALEIEALEAVGDLKLAIAIARQHRRAAAIANDPAGVTTYTLHIARLLERNHNPIAAEFMLAEALTTVQAPTTDRLRLLVALLGLWRRRSIDPGEPAYESLRAEAAKLHGALGDPAVKKVPGLLRDLAAEMSVDQPAILEHALRAIGVDASADGSVPDALRALDALMAAEQGTPGLVADLTRLGQPDDPVSWQAIVTMPRGETGRALLDVLNTFGDSADLLRLAVRADYQQEADAALLGKKFNIYPKA